MLRILCTLLMLVSLSGCHYSYVKKINDEEISRVVNVFSEKMKYEKHLDLDDSCIFYEDHVNRIRLNYSSMDTLYMLEARALLVDLVEDFVGRMNDNLMIADSLGPMPFGPENLEIYIKFVSFYNRFVDNNAIGLITLRNGVAHFIAADYCNCDARCWQRRREYYYQTKNFVNFQRQGEALYKPRAPEGKQRWLKDERFYPVNTSL